MKRTFLFFLALVFVISSCTQNINIKHKTATVSLTFKKMFYLPEAAPGQFESSLPSSPLILNGVTYFKKVYPFIVVATDVKGVAFSKGLALLKQGIALFLNSECGSITLKRDYNHILKNGRYVFVFDGRDGSIIDTRLCGTVGSVKILAGDVVFRYPFVCFVNGKNFVVVRSGYGVYLKGGLTNSIVRAGFFKENLVFLDGLGRLVFLSLKKKQFVRLFKLIPFEKAEIVNGYIYGIKGKTFYVFKLKPYGEPVKLYSFNVNPPCILSLNYPAAICSGELIKDNRTRSLSIKFSKFFISKDYLIGFKSGSVYLVDIKKRRYIKGFIMTKPQLRGCLHNGILYFKDFDGRIKEYLNGTTKTVNAIPDNCTDVEFYKGRFLYDNRTIYEFARPVKQKNGVVMLKRRSGDTIYYFFEKLN